MNRLLRIALLTMVLSVLGVGAASTRFAEAAGGGEREIWIVPPGSSGAERASNGASRLEIAGQGFSWGSVTVYLYQPGEESGAAEYEFETTAAPGQGSFDLVTPLYNCAFDQPVNGIPYVAYAYDRATQIWSSGVDVFVCEGMVFDGPQDMGIDVASAYEPGQGNATVSFGGQEQTVDYGASANDNAGTQQSGAATTSGPHISVTTYVKSSVSGCSYYDEDAQEWVCSSSSDGDIPRFKVLGDGFSSFGAISVGVYLPGTDTLVAQYDTVTTYGNRIDVGTDIFDCSGHTNGVKQYEIQAYDWTTDTWSNTVTITACAAVL